MHLTFHPLTLHGREIIADDAVCLTLAVPPACTEEFRFMPGQHLPVRAIIDGRELRRTYSIVAGLEPGTLRLGIRIQSPGGLSHHLAHGIAVGEAIDAMPPTGSFTYQPDASRARRYLMIAAGSGITPVLSILEAILGREPGSVVTLVYGNRTIASTMFLEELLALKNQHLNRLAIHFLMSREPQDVSLLNGRVDGGKLGDLARGLVDFSRTDEVFVCGQGGMVQDVRTALTTLGAQIPVHFERFSAAIAPPVNPASHAAKSADESRITIIQDGRRRTVTMTNGDDSVLAAAARCGVELPFSCRAGVCGTCRARVLEGSVEMSHNVALEPWELEAGYVLTCQSRANSPEVVISYDDK